jgi:hypothetical protein
VSEGRRAHHREYLVKADAHARAPCAFRLIAGSVRRDIANAA